jgi:hypothetical protein
MYGKAFAWKPARAKRSQDHEICARANEAIPQDYKSQSRQTKANEEACTAAVDLGMAQQKTEWLKALQQPHRALLASHWLETGRYGGYSSASTKAAVADRSLARLRNCLKALTLWET